MKESYGKGLASRPDPESCVGVRKEAGEALTGAHAGQPLSCDISRLGCRRGRLTRKATSWAASSASRTWTLRSRRT
jgi:hypothetical protein